MTSSIAMSTYHPADHCSFRPFPTQKLERIQSDQPGPFPYLLV